MPEIKKTVGVSGINSHDDVALIQAMLVVVKNAKGVSYLNTYDGAFGKHTKDAIISFQEDNVFKHIQGFTDAGASLKAAIPNAKKGTISPSDDTFKQLVAMLPDAYKDISVLPTGKTVYLGAAKDDVTNSQINIQAEKEVDLDFRGKVLKLIEQMYDKHKVAVWVTPDGRRRTFDQQYKLSLTPNTHAGPGESNHNYGKAVDVGFKGLRWLRPDGSIVTDDYWLHKLDPKQTIAAEARVFWRTMQSVATDNSVGLFRGPDWDNPHLQAWNDQHVGMGRSLAKLLNDSGAMQWGHKFVAKKNTYESDLGAKGKMYNVGTAQQIWHGDATVDKQMIASMRNDLAKKSAKFSGPNAKNFKPMGAAEIKQAEVDAMKTALQSDFQKADLNWKKWTPQ